MDATPPDGENRYRNPSGKHPRHEPAHSFPRSIPCDRFHQPRRGFRRRRDKPLEPDSVYAATPLVGKALPWGCTRHQYPAACARIAAYPFTQLVRNDVYRLRHPQLRTYPALIQETYGKKLKTLNRYAKLITLAKGETWQAPALRELTDKLDIDGHSPAEALMQLSKELDRLDLRNNQLLYVILEGSMFFQLRQIVRIERWKARYGKYLMGWLEAVGELDALCSLGTFAYNHPAYTYPTIAGQPFCFLARNMGHPLMPEAQCVKNDAAIPSRPYFLIITGANMAGKSTYLRTIGVNYLLACMGCPVCCESLTLYPAQLITSLRTTDSLSDNESYFFAELKRLKRIIDLLNEGKELFIILDEILKGTNSADKQKGSLDLIRQFMRLKADGIIATHDLLLGTLAEQFPDEIRNYCFEADITDNELTFSYRLREGVAQNMNACFLMKKMGITVR